MAVLFSPPLHSAVEALSALPEFQPSQNAVVESYREKQSGSYELREVRQENKSRRMMGTPVFAVLEVSQRTHHSFHPRNAGTKVSGIRKVIMSESLLKFFRHFLEVCEVASPLHMMCAYTCMCGTCVVSNIILHSIPDKINI